MVEYDKNIARCGLLGVNWLRGAGGGVRVSDAAAPPAGTPRATLLNHLKFVSFSVLKKEVCASSYFP